GQEQGLVAGVETRRAHLKVLLSRHAEQRIDLHGSLDLVGERLVARLDRRALHKLELPAMRVLKRCVASVEQSPQEVERGSRLAICLELAARIGSARLCRELRTVDDVPAITRQLLAGSRLGRRGTRLGELAGNATNLHHLRIAAEGED